MGYNPAVAPRERSDARMEKKLRSVCLEPAISVIDTKAPPD